MCFHLSFSSRSWLILLIASIGCAKEPGIGGRAEIHGRVLERHQGSGEYYPLADHDVFIVFGDGTTPDDDVSTGPDGRFRFPWLRKGAYRVFTISECDWDLENCPG